jgi:hypothetical protein
MMMNYFETKNLDTEELSELEIDSNSDEDDVFGETHSLESRAEVAWTFLSKQQDRVGVDFRSFMNDALQRGFNEAEHKCPVLQTPLKLNCSPLCYDIETDQKPFLAHARVVFDPACEAIKHGRFHRKQRGRRLFYLVVRSRDKNKAPLAVLCLNKQSRENKNFTVFRTNGRKGVIQIRFQHCLLRLRAAGSGTVYLGVCKKNKNQIQTQAFFNFISCIPDDVFEVEVTAFECHGKPMKLTQTSQCKCGSTEPAWTCLDLNCSCSVCPVCEKQTKTKPKQIITRVDIANSNSRNKSSSDESIYCVINK